MFIASARQQTDAANTFSQWLTIASSIELRGIFTPRKASWVLQFSLDARTCLCIFTTKVRLFSWLRFSWLRFSNKSGLKHWNGRLLSTFSFNAFVLSENSPWSQHTDLSVCHGPWAVCVTLFCTSKMEWRDSGAIQAHKWKWVKVVEWKNIDEMMQVESSQRKNATIGS